MPKFSFESNLKLNEVLKRIGLVEGFSDSADFNGISDIPLHISDVRQRAKIEVCQV